MAMYYKYDGREKWYEPYRTLRNSPVECRADSGKHGANSDPTPRVYARRGSNRAAYTHRKDRSVNWGSSPTHKKITVWDSNYLNWYHNPPGSSMRRTDIVKTVTKNVLGSIKDVNVGFMRFHHSEGGPVIHAVKDLDDNRSEVNNIVNNIPADGWTPLSETMYEAARYWSGMTSYYGGSKYTDNDAFATKYVFDDDDDYSFKGLYKQPAEYACSKNFVVLLTDGEPTKDRGAYKLSPKLPNYPKVMGRSNCNGGDVDGACLDDIAEYLSKVDVNPKVPGKQSVTTYTIGFTVDLPILKRTAENSGGEYYLASDVKSLTAALTDIVTDIFDRDISFTAPAIAVNTFNRTQNLNDLYVSVFRATDEVHWPGNLKKYQLKEGEIRDANDKNAVNPDTGFFSDKSRNFWMDASGNDGANVHEGGAASRLPHPDDRNIYTNYHMGDLTTPDNALRVSNSGLQYADNFGLIGADNEPSITELIEYARGYDVRDDDNDPETTVRKQMGDSLHSQPAAVAYGDKSGSMKTVIFSATNDGFIHAIDAATGKEMWSFIPHSLLPNLKDLYFNRNIDYKNYGIDGDVVPIVADLNRDGAIEPGTDYVYLVFGMRRGGDRYFMMDVTNPSRPILKWIRTFPEFGQTWSTPSVARIKINSNSVSSKEDAVLVVGGGYDTTHDTAAHPDQPDLEGAGIHMLDLDTGASIWRAGSDDNANLKLKKMTRSIPSRVRVIDLTGDGYADRMYAADLGGQVWRFDISNGEATNKLVAGGVIAQLGAEGLKNPGAADTRRFYTTPDVAMFVDDRLNRRFLSVSIGTGYRAHPLDNSASDRFYSLRDPNVLTSLSQSQYDNYDIIEDGDLINVSGKHETVIPGTGRGWKLVLPPEQKVLSDSRTFNDLIYFVTLQPEIDSTDPCRAGLSTNRLYRVNVDNGDPVWGDGNEPIPGIEPEPEVIDAARVIELEQSGIAPAPVFLFPSHWDPECQGDECKTRPVACVGVECFDPEFNNMPVRTLWTQDGID